ncbi:rubredoxin [Methylosinus sp. Sm6]|uniref:rubredoxin n=1 Tax=Methylosinus sp. Sm6 TaxID=2866948 RepID=UPI001C9913EC|nr:rubredoxin [Methylosinus sp. Sm6]MBY6241971.1 rubredoxin [Methylosinus sp. Sm6]
MSDDVSEATRMECGVCWHVYDPAEGDPVWQIPPGVAFTDLPEDWRCPECDAPREKFLRLGE